MNLNRLDIVLADDDKDDCSFFDEALKKIPIATDLKIVHDGEMLMDYLYINSDHLPDVVFLDLSMPRKNGFECLSEIKGSSLLKNLNIVMFSTSFPQGLEYEEKMITLLLKLGALEHIRKSHDWAKIGQVIHKTLIMLKDKNLLIEN